MNAKMVMTLLSGALPVVFGCSQQASVPVVAVEDKDYAVNPPSVKVNAGILIGEITEMKVMERVEKESGKVVAPARLTGKLSLKNSSADQTVRLIDGSIQYVNTDNQLMKVEDKRTETSLKFSSYGGNERLDPGQSASQSINVDFPAEALKANSLKGIRLDVVYIPSAFKEQSLSFNVSVGR